MQNKKWGRLLAYVVGLSYQQLLLDNRLSLWMKPATGNGWFFKLDSYGGSMPDKTAVLDPVGIAQYSMTPEDKSAPTSHGEFVGQRTAKAGSPQRPLAKGSPSPLGDPPALGLAAHPPQSMRNPFSTCLPRCSMPWTEPQRAKLPRSDLKVRHTPLESGPPNSDKMAFSPVCRIFLDNPWFWA